jgi:hypothetical protein
MMPYFLSIYLSIYGFTALCWALAAFSVSWSFTQSVGLLGWGISPLQGRYLHTGQHKHRINVHRQPCLKWDSNPWSQCLCEWRRFMPSTVRILWSDCRTSTSPHIYTSVSLIKYKDNFICAFYKIRQQHLI